MFPTVQACLSPAWLIGWNKNWKGIQRRKVSTLIQSLLSVCQPCLNKGLGSLQFPSGASPVVSKMLIYSGHKLNDARAPPLPPTCTHNLIHLDSLLVLRDNSRTKGLRLNLFTDDGRLKNWPVIFLFFIRSSLQHTVIGDL